jgi:hypothetical protein
MFRSFRFSIFAIAVSTISAQTPAREVAITFDDLPIAGVLPRDLEASRELTRKLLAAITAHHVPVIGFVNEDKLNAADGAVAPARVDLLRRWLEAGAELRQQPARRQRKPADQEPVGRDRLDGGAAHFEVNGGYGGNGITQRSRATEIGRCFLCSFVALCNPVSSVPSVTVRSTSASVSAHRSSCAARGAAGALFARRG